MHKKSPSGEPTLLVCRWPKMTGVWKKDLPLMSSPVFNVNYLLNFPAIIGCVSFVLSSGNDAVGGMVSSAHFQEQLHACMLND